MYRFHDAQSGFIRMRHWCVPQVWRGRIKIVSVGAKDRLLIGLLMRFFSNITSWINKAKGAIK